MSFSKQGCNKSGDADLELGPVHPAFVHQRHALLSGLAKAKQCDQLQLKSKCHNHPVCQAIG